MDNIYLFHTTDYLNRFITQFLCHYIKDNMDEYICRAIRKALGQ